MSVRWLVSVFLALALGGPLAAQEDPPVFGSEVSLVLLPVFVADEDGRAVRGLQPEDFEVYEDGKLVEIVSYRYVDTTDVEQAEELRQATAARRRFLLLFDKSFTSPSGLNRARKAAAQFVRTDLAPSDLAAVATFDVSNGLRVVANFTEDRALLAHAVETLGVPQLTRISDPLSLAADIASTDIVTGRGGGAEDETPQELLNAVLSVLVRQLQSAEREQYRANILTFIGSLEDLARGLRNVEGRKQVIYFAGGFDSRLLVGEEGRERANTALSIVEGRLWEVDGMARHGDSRLRGLLDDATESLTRSDSVVHTIDVTGLGEDASLTRRVPRSDPQRSVSGRESLNLIAAETGGRFFRDTNNLEPVLDEMLSMTSRYYVLGFQPRQAKGPGSFHKVKVEVARRKTNLSHRAGYYERVPAGGQTPLQRQFEAAQLVMTGVGDDNLPFSSLCLPFPEPGEHQTLGLVIQIPRESLGWEEGQTSALEIYGYAVGEDGSVRDHLAQFARFDPGKVDPLGLARGISFYGTLSVPPGKYILRLMLHEREQGLSGAQFIDVTVPPYDALAGFLLPPVLVEDTARWLSLEMGQRRARRRPNPFQVDGQPFLPRADFAVQGDRPETLVLMAYEPRQSGDPAADIHISSSLVDGAGARVSPGQVRIDRVLRNDDGHRTYVLGYTPQSLAEGDYTLHVRVGEAGSLLESYTLLRMRPRP